jgi:predicted esterase
LEHQQWRDCIMNRILGSFLCALALPASALAQGGPKEVRVSTPTRLDWKFASFGFGPGSEKMENYDSAKQRYVLHVPKNYKTDKAWPLVVFISPGDGPSGWASWKTVCEKKGVLFCSPYGAGNATRAGRRTRIVLDMLDDVRRKYQIDPDQTYLSGFSGGGRMACAIAFALPEWFGGVAPICGTNPISGPAYLRHRTQERLSVAFITGSTDFNRKENEEYMAPYFKELDIRSKLWVVPKLGHAIPGSDTLAKVYAWLEEDLPRRRAEVKARPGLTMSAKETPAGEQQAARVVETALADLKQPDRVWRGVCLLQGVVARWNKTEPGLKARKILKELVNDEKLLQTAGEQGAEDEQKSLSAQAKAFERFGQRDQAIQAWELLAKNQPDTPAGKNAAVQAKRLRDGKKN